MSDHSQEQEGISDKHNKKSDAATPSPSEHVPRLITSHHGHAHVHGTGAVGRFNKRLAVLITKSVGTMWAAYMFFLIALVSMPQAWAAFLKGDTVTGVSWLSQSFLQLVLLPIIIVGQNVISASQDARAEGDHRTLTLLHKMNVRQLEILEQQKDILELLQKTDA
jgi:hypothetical protein